MKAHLDKSFCFKGVYVPNQNNSTCLLQEDLFCSTRRKMYVFEMVNLHQTSLLLLSSFYCVYIGYKMSTELFQV